MRHFLQKAARFIWRFGRNMICVTPWGRNRIFPAESLANRFGRGDADYAIGVFMHHQRQLAAAGFPGGARILEVGPGRNLGTSLLMWAQNDSQMGRPVSVYLWDVFPNMVVNADTLAEVAGTLLESPMLKEVSTALPDIHIEHTLSKIAQGNITPDIRYRVQSLSALLASGEAKELELVFSHAAIEHIWHVDKFWTALIGLTKSGGWHSHRIDLADHGRRETNYIEMLEWSRLGYWLTMRFIPGAINRWRASDHRSFIFRNGLKILSENREMREKLPIPRNQINRCFSLLDDVELRTTAVDLVGVKSV